MVGHGVVDGVDAAPHPLQQERARSTYINTILFQLLDQPVLDGVILTHLLGLFLHLVGCRVSPYTPLREKHGYTTLTRRPADFKLQSHLEEVGMPWKRQRRN